MNLRHPKFPDCTAEELEAGDDVCIICRNVQLTLQSQEGCAPR